MKYPKMCNLFNHEGKMSHPVAWYLRDCEWLFLEKIDGTNIRVIFDENGRRTVKGRTDRAVLLPRLIDVVMEATKEVELHNAIIYGEGFGGKIQAGAARYGADLQFQAFDLLYLDNNHWGEWEDLEELPCPTVPAVWNGLLIDGALGVVKGWKSIFSDALSEGLVARPVCPGLRMYGGTPIRAKLKHCNMLGKPELLGGF